MGAMLNYFQTGVGAPSGAPSVPGAEWVFYQRSDNGAIYYWDLNASAWVIVAGAIADYPKRALLLHDESLVVIGNALERQHTTLMNYGTESLQNPSANGDTFTQSFLLMGGTYTLAVLGLTAAANGKLDWYVDDVLQGAGGQDWYSGSTTYNVIKTLSVSVLTDGYHVLKGVVNGKNASSLNYNIQLAKMWLYPSAD